MKNSIVTFKKDVTWACTDTKVPKGLIGVVMDNSAAPSVYVGEDVNIYDLTWNSAFFDKADLIVIGEDKKLTKQLEENK